MIRLLTAQATKVEIAESVIAGISRYFSVKVIEILLDQLGSSLVMTESIVGGCVENKEHGQVPVTDDILMAAKEHPEGGLITTLFSHD